VKATLEHVRLFYQELKNGCEMVTIEYKFNIHDRVLLIDLETYGTVDSLTTDINGSMYRVVFWYNGDRKSVWVYDYEIKHVKGTKK